MLGSVGFSQLTFTVTKTFGSYTLTCDTTFVTLQAASNYSIPPTFIYTNPSSQTLSGGTQTITASGVWTITANAGSITASQTLAITINTAVPTLTLVSSPASITCNTPTVLLSATVNPSNVLISWTEPGVGLGCTSTTCIAATSGTYGLSVTNPVNGCEASATISIGDNRLYPILATANLYTVACPNGTVDLGVTVQNSTIGLLYQWGSPFGAITSGSNTPILNTNAPGSYTLTVTNSSNGCSTKTEVLVFACVGLDEFTLNSIKLFPIPVSEELYVQFGSDPRSVKVIVYDIWGREMKVQLLNTDGRISLETLSSGIYFIQLEAGETTRIMKVIKE